MQNVDTEALKTAREIAQDSDCARDRLLDRVCAEGFDRETARRAVQRLSFDEEPTVARSN